MTERVLPTEIPWEHSFADFCPWLPPTRERPGLWQEIKETQRVHREARQILQRFLASEQVLVQTVGPTEIFDARICAAGTVLYFEEERKEPFGQTQSSTYWGIVVHSSQQPFLSNGDRTVVACYDVNLIEQGQPKRWPRFTSPVVRVGFEQHRRVKRTDGATDETLSRIKWLKVWRGVGLTTTEVRPKQAA